MGRCGPSALLCLCFKTQFVQQRQRPSQGLWSGQTQWCVCVRVRHWDQSHQSSRQGEDVMVAFLSRAQPRASSQWGEHDVFSPDKRPSTGANLELTKGGVPGANRAPYKEQTVFPCTRRSYTSILLRTGTSTDRRTNRLKVTRSAWRATVQGVDWTWPVGLLKYTLSTTPGTKSTVKPKTKTPGVTHTYIQTNTCVRRGLNGG